MPVMTVLTKSTAERSAGSMLSATPAAGQCDSTTENVHSYRHADPWLPFDVLTRDHREWIFTFHLVAGVAQWLAEFVNERS